MTCHTRHTHIVSSLECVCVREVKTARVVSSVAHIFQNIRQHSNTTAFLLFCYPFRLMPPLFHTNHTIQFPFSSTNLTHCEPRPLSGRARGEAQRRYDFPLTHTTLTQRVSATTSTCILYPI